MKTSGYKFGQKNNWRRWVWNRVDERIDKPRKDCVILYLAGEEDLDRPIAISKGFRAENLIAVERDRKTAEILRGRGVICINSEIEDAIMCFKDSKIKLDIIIADLCCGLTEKISKFVRTLNSCHWMIPDKCVVMSNFMRGRDPGWLLDASKQSAPFYHTLESEDGSDQLHRGKLFLSTFTNVFMGTIRSKLSVEQIRGYVQEAALYNFKSMYKIPNPTAAHMYMYMDKLITIIKESLENQDIANRSRIIEHLTNWDEIQDLETLSYMHTCIAMDSMDPEFSTYKSGPVYMDSCVFTMNRSFLCTTNKTVDEPIKKSFDAMMAVRTMRSNGTLAPCPVC